MITMSLATTPLLRHAVARSAYATTPLRMSRQLICPSLNEHDQEIRTIEVAFIVQDVHDPPLTEPSKDSELRFIGDEMHCSNRFPGIQWNLLLCCQI